jgi:hypothetical protein
MVSGQLHAPATITRSAVSLRNTKAAGVRLCVGWDTKMFSVMSLAALVPERAEMVSGRPYVLYGMCYTVLY